jgi:hypothetical protein
LGSILQHNVISVAEWLGTGDQTTTGRGTRDRSDAACTGARRDGLCAQAARIAVLGSPFVSHLVEAAWRALDRAPALALMLDSWPGDFGADAVALRLASALHALALRGTPPRLAALFAAREGDFDSVVGEALAQQEKFIIAWMARPTQTNEVARSAALMAALLTLDAERAMPVDLLELGASAGLNLNVAHYRFILGDTACGPADSPLQLAPDWQGGSPPQGRIAVASARGVDLAPINCCDPAAALRMQAYVWPDKPGRLVHLSAAQQIARVHPPQVDRGNAATWLRQRLALPQARGTRRVIFHSMVMQYLSAGERGAIAQSIIRAGALATPDNPLAWIALEWTPDRRAVMLHATHWGGGMAGQGGTSDGCGSTRALARCDPYGEWLAWLVP